MNAKTDDVFVRSAELQEMLGVKRTKAFLIIKQLNKELADKGYITIRGRVPRKYFYERLGIVGAKA
ncbi:hypothetical protein [Schwartzia succinivorans]|jgi:hypothetical protein|uniref:ICEBs1 excisionase n=1 Tax=Schwartzia succinivorans DSM 10502 TaxID=1123243 RepID=A0A1M4V0T8_9FIRM|nr:hypothetical protein [Schwartzia succinivorans]SHE62601.1 hypothetical protein SAMN02745190_00844 [Schwartzia succinivorans DSM 10502]